MAAAISTLSLVAEIRNWMLFAWSVAACTVGCGALMWWNQRRVGVVMKYFDARTPAVFADHVQPTARVHRSRVDCEAD
jgi:hypothetical protein